MSLAGLLAVVALAGCGSSSSAGTASQTTAASTTSASTTSASTTSPSSTGASNTASKAAHGSAKTSTIATTEAAKPQVGGRLLRQFTGSGNTRLGTVVVSSPQVLVWSAQHPPIQIFTAHGFMVVSSHAPSGSVQLSQGTYQGLRVATHGSWSIELRSRS